MRHFGGIVLCVAIGIAGCASTGEVATSRSTLGSSAPVTDTTAASTSATFETSTTVGPVPDTTAPEAPDPAEAAADNPLPVGTATVRSAPAPTPPSGPQPTGRIDIPAIGLSHATYEGIDLAIINYGPSHWPGTARPGHAGNSVFPGHRTTYSRPFWDIDLLVPGDTVTFTTDEGRFTYRITRTFIVDDEETWIVKPTDKPTFTIFGCHPKGSARQRYVVKGELISPPATTTTTTTRPPETTTTTTEPEDEGLLDVLFG